MNEFELENPGKTLIKDFSRFTGMDKGEGQTSSNLFFILT